MLDNFPSLWYICSRNVLDEKKGFPFLPIFIDLGGKMRRSYWPLRLIV
jgi:hypothetical protein